MDRKGGVAVSMCELLVSVRSVAEARVALAAEVSFVDVKEPDAGPLGAASRGVQRAVVRLARGRRVTLSAALGELLALDPRAPGPAMSGMPLCKVGLAGCEALDWRGRLDDWQRRLAAGPGEPALVPAAYADHVAAAAPEPRLVLGWAVDRGAPYLLVDTFDKGSGRLTTRLDTDALAGLVEDGRAAGVRLVLAGSVRLEEIESLAGLGPAAVGVRGAVCEGGDRRAALDPARLREALTRGRTARRAW